MVFASNSSQTLQCTLGSEMENHASQGKEYIVFTRLASAIHSSMTLRNAKFAVSSLRNNRGPIAEIMTRHPESMTGGINWLDMVVNLSISIK